MPKESFARWGKQKINVSKSPFIYKPFTSLEIPVEYFKTDEALKEYFSNLHFPEGYIYLAHGYRFGKTKTHIAWTKCLFKIEPQGETVRIIDSRRLNLYWFRRRKK